MYLIYCDIYFILLNKEKENNEWKIIMKWIILLISFTILSCNPKCNSQPKKPEVKTQNTTDVKNYVMKKESEQRIELIKEKLVLSDYVIYHETTSKIDPTAKIFDIDFNTIKCPYCKYEQRVPKHGETIICPKYGMEMTAWGNSLKCRLLKPIE